MGIAMLCGHGKRRIKKIVRAGIPHTELRLYFGISAFSRLSFADVRRIIVTITIFGVDEEELE
jgi:hypothetical protein